MDEETTESSNQVLRERMLYFAMEMCTRGALQHPADLDAFLLMVTKLEEFVEKT